MNPADSSNPHPTKSRSAKICASTRRQRLRRQVRTRCQQLEICQQLVRRGRTQMSMHISNRRVLSRLPAALALASVLAWSFPAPSRARTWRDMTSTTSTTDTSGTAIRQVTTSASDHRCKEGTMKFYKWETIILTVLLLISGSCSIEADQDIASTETLREMLHTRAGSIYGYSSLADQVLDSDAVIVGRITGVESAGLEHPDDGSGDPVEYMSILIDVIEVVHTGPNISIEPGSSIKVETFLPELTTLSQANEAIPSNNLGIHFLFSAAMLRQRVGEPVGNATGRWIYQNTSSAVLRDEYGAARAVDGAPALTSLSTFANFLTEARASASEISDRQRPTAPIGLGPTASTE